MCIRKNYILNIIRKWRKPCKEIPPLIKAAQKAKEDWQYAQRMYHSAVEPELIDCASYLIKAYERQYIYILREVKREGLQITMTELELIDNEETRRELSLTK